MNETTTKTDGIVVSSVETLPKTITKNELINIVREQKGYTFIQLFATTDVKMNKGGRENTNYLFGNVVKDGNVNAGLDFEYENSVNNALKKEGETPDFVSQPRKWGEHMIIDYVFDKKTLEFKPVFSRSIIEHIKDGEKRYYLQLKVNPEKCKKAVYRYKDSGEVLSETDKAVMYSYMPARKEEIVVLRDYRIDNVKRIHINNEQYIISDE
jgi:hypothetical protein